MPLSVGSRVGCSSPGSRPTPSAGSSRPTTSGAASPCAADEEPPSYESLLQQQRLAAGLPPEDGKPVVTKQYFTRKVLLTLVILLLLSVFGLVGFLTNYLRAEKIHDEIDNIKYNHIKSLREQTEDLDSRSEDMLRQLQLMARRMHEMDKEIKMLKGEAEKADAMKISQLEEWHEEVMSSVSFHLPSSHLTFISLTLITLVMRIYS